MARCNEKIVPATLLFKVREFGQHFTLLYVVFFAGYLTSSQGLCNIGEWHSHHTLGLAEPSDGDQQTVWNHIPSVAGGRFLVFIANIRGIAP